MPQLTLFAIDRETFTFHTLTISQTKPTVTSQRFAISTTTLQEEKQAFPKLNFIAEPQAGKMIIFPASYLHCSEPITSGEKHVIVSWLVGPPPRTWL
jgi:hypothetical protein